MKDEFIFFTISPCVHIQGGYYDMWRNVSRGNFSMMAKEIENTNINSIGS